MFTTRRAEVDSGMIQGIMSGKLRSTNTSGVTGVRIHHNVASVVYEALIVVNGKTIRLGRYATLESAAKARKRAENKYFSHRILPKKGK